MSYVEVNIHTDQKKYLIILAFALAHHLNIFQIIRSPASRFQYRVNLHVFYPPRAQIASDGSIERLDAPFDKDMSLEMSDESFSMPVYKSLALQKLAGPGPVGNEGPSTFTGWYIGDETSRKFPTGRAS